MPIFSGSSRSRYSSYRKRLGVSVGLSLELSSLKPRYSFTSDTRKGPLEVQLPCCHFHPISLCHLCPVTQWVYVLRYVQKLCSCVTWPISPDFQLKLTSDFHFLYLEETRVCILTGAGMPFSFFYVMFPNRVARGLIVTSVVSSSSPFLLHQLPI